ncbi:YgaP family membrane protein [Meinhardsimonia xiamenensis]|jgi:hypothetical protein|nr:DUF2892 domain-containing protein [Meinhardsimonia xiamenensis]
MKKKNEGIVDRTLRVTLGSGLLISFFIFPEASWRWWLLLGFFPLISGLVGYCPLYSRLGLCTCPKDQA